MTPPISELSEREEMKPCPFCGSELDANDPANFDTDHTVAGKWGFVVCCCSGPEVRTGYGPLADWKAEAIAAWNRRSLPTGEDVGIERIPPSPSADPYADRVVRAERGPVRLLCDEIGFAFDPRLEQPAVLLAFVGELLGEIEQQREIAGRVARMGGKGPSEASAKVLESARLMVAADSPALAVVIAENVHDLAHEFNPEDAYPTDHLIDMLSSCASAVRFGLESPCRSRHAAAAAQHVWKQVYGVSRFDGHTPAWDKEWARSKLLSAIVSLLPALKAARDDSVWSAAATQESPTQ